MQKDIKKTELQDKIKQERAKRKELINSLVSEIKTHQELYYNAQPSISDAEFDALWDRLRAIDPDNTIFTSVGSDSSFFAKLQHIMPMGSLDKASDENQFLEWAHKHESPFYLVQYKLDGASLELQYKNAQLQASVTRGNGKIGDDILINARNMQGVPKNISKKIDKNISFAVRGEVIMRHNIHKKYFSDKANCRNAANGLMKRKDGIGVEHLEVICYDIWFENLEHEKKAIEFLKKNCKVESKEFLLERDKMQLLAVLGFTVVEHTICKNAQAVCEYRKKIVTQRNKIKYDIDGLVVKMPSADKDDMASLLPDKQIAFKFPLEHAISTLQGVEWSPSGHLYTPVALLSPVRIAGTNVSRASLVHSDLIREMQIKIGSELMVVKRGEIIPKVEKVVFTPDDAKDINPPKICEVCGGEVIDGGTKIYCANIECRKRLLFRVQRWINIMEVDHWGEKLIHKLVMQEKIINKIGDLYKITAEKLCSLERIAMPLAEKLYNALHEKKNIGFEQFVASIGIENVALLTGEKLVASGVSNWQKLVSISEEELSSIDGVGEVIAKHIKNACNLLKDELEEVLTYVSIKETKKTGKLLGKSFCFTGTLVHEGETLARKTLQDAVKKAGGTIKSSVTKDLTYLVTANKESNSSKSKKAQEYGVSVIDAKDFFELL